MGFLLSGISFIFAFVFLAFFKYSQNFQGNHLEGIFPSLLFPLFFFLLIGLFFLFSFSKFSFPFLEKKEKRVQSILQRDYKKIFKNFILSYAHYLSYIFFYAGVFLVSKYFSGLHFSYCIFFVNIFVLVFFYFFYSLRFSKDFLRINQIIFSLIYLVSYAVIFWTKDNFFIYIDFINSFLIIVSFILMLYLNRSLRGDRFFIINLFFYVYGFIIFYLSFLFQENYFFLCSVNIVLSILIIHGGVKYLPKKNPYITITRAFGLILGYVGTLVGIMYILKEGFDEKIYILLSISIIHNILFHRKFQNYVCYFLAIVTSSLLLFIPSFGNIDGAYNYIFILIFSYFLVLSSFFFRQKFKSDDFFIHLISYIYNLGGVLLFILYYKPNFGELAALMFIEFIYFFLSYYSLSKT